MTRYDFLCARRVNLRNVRTDSNSISVLVNFSCELVQIMIRYGFQWARRVILSNAGTDSDFN